MSEREPAAERRAGGTFVQAVSLLRRNRDFRTLYLASLISFGGDWFLFVALAGRILDITDSAVAVGLILFSQEIPFLVMSPIGGALVDRLDRRKLMVACDLARATLCLGFPLLGRETYWVAYPLLAAMSSFSAGFDPASQAALPNLVEPEDLGPANALSGSTWGTMLAVGAALGGVVSATFGANTAFLVDAASFLVSAALIASIRRRFAEDRGHVEHPRIVQATRETITYARRDHRVLALLAVKAGFGFGAGVLVLISVFATDEFHRGDVGIGILMGARGVGALIGPFLGKWISGRDDRRLFTTIGMALGLFGAAYALFATMPTIWLAALVVGVAHLGGGAQWALSSYGLQRIVPDHIRGRIFAFDGAMITLTLAISSIVTGVVAEHVGPRPTAIGLGIVSLAWAAAWTLLTTDVRRGALLEGSGLAPEQGAA